MPAVGNEARHACIMWHCEVCDERRHSTTVCEVDRGPVCHHDRGWRMGRIPRAEYPAHCQRLGWYCAPGGKFGGDITLNVLLYALLRPVSRNLSLLGACFGLMGTAVFAAGEMLYFAAALPAVDADVAQVISPEAKATLTYLGLTIYGYGFGIFATFYGTAAVVRGYLILRSGYLPRALGAILILGGTSFIVKNFLVVLAPHYDLPYVIVPMFLAMISLTLWLLIKGVDSARWTARRTEC